MRRVIITLALGTALLVLGSTLGSADTGTTVATTDVPASTAATEAQPQPATSVSLSLALSATTVSYGERVQASGTLAPALVGQPVTIEIGDGQSWAQLAVATTDPTGSFQVEFDALTGGLVRARDAASGATSQPLELAVTPVVRVKVTGVRAFSRARMSVFVSPSSYDARASAVVRQNGRRVARANGHVHGGRLNLNLPTPGVGTFWVELTLPAASGLAARSIGTKLVAQGRTLRVGSSGPDVRALERRLAELAIHVPGPSTTFSSELYDSVIAFQKAYRLARTGVVDRATWRMLDRAEVLRPRYRSPSVHIEIDKTRQILLVVHGGKIAAILPASTGATGNTPEGRHHIRWKAPATTTWLGSGILYRTLTFYGNSFAIHGWYSVPAYPASHGCVRIPIWTADWLYNQSPVGETVYVYR
jgi:lipoprotein-anchoring transpeptidase ErfK/SrfK